MSHMLARESDPYNGSHSGTYHHFCSWKKKNQDLLLQSQGHGLVQGRLLPQYLTVCLIKWFSCHQPAWHERSQKLLSVHHRNTGYCSSLGFPLWLPTGLAELVQTQS